MRVVVTMAGWAATAYAMGWWGLRGWPLVEQSAAECGSAMQLVEGVARLDGGKVLTSC